MYIHTYIHTYVHTYEHTARRPESPCTVTVSSGGSGYVGMYKRIMKARELTRVQSKDAAGRKYSSVAIACAAHIQQLVQGNLCCQSWRKIYHCSGRRL